MLLFGTPAIIESDNGSEFTAQVVTELKKFWSHLLMVHGKPRHRQSQGSMEHSKSDIKDMLVAWISENNTTDRSFDLRFVKKLKPSAHYSGIKCIQSHI